MAVTRLEGLVRRHGGRVVLVLMALMWLVQIGRLLWVRWSWN